MKVEKIKVPGAGVLPDSVFDFDMVSVPINRRHDRHQRQLQPDAAACDR